MIAPGREPADGDIAAVIYTTAQGVRGPVVKHVRHTGNVLILESSNPKYPPVILTSRADPVIEGLVVGVVRQVT